MFIPLVLRIPFRVDGNTNRINHIPYPVGTVHVYILDDASVHFVQTFIVFLQKMRELFLGDIEFVDTVSVGGDEHLFRIFPVGDNGIYTDVFQVVSQIRQFAGGRRVNKKFVEQGIDDKFPCRLVIVYVVNDMNRGYIYFLDVFQLSILKGNRIEMLFVGYEVFVSVSLRDTSHFSRNLLTYFVCFLFCPL